MPRAAGHGGAGALVGEDPLSFCGDVPAEVNVAISVPGAKKLARPSNDSTSVGTPHEAAKKARGVMRKVPL